MIPKIDVTDLYELANLMSKKWPRFATYATAKTLNYAAMKSREGIADEVDSELTVRNRGLLRAGIKYTGVSPNLPIRDQTVLVGFVELKRFTGWVEQETGGQDERKRKHILSARIGKRAGGKVRQNVRFKPSKDVYEAVGDADFKEMYGTIRSWSRYNEPFMVTSHSKLKDGVYLITPKNKLVFLAYRNKDQSVRRVHMLQPGFEKTMRKYDMGKKFRREMQKQFIRARRR